jgi:hypothetical protein
MLLVLNSGIKTTSHNDVLSMRSLEFTDLIVMPEHHNTIRGYLEDGVKSEQVSRRVCTGICICVCCVYVCVCVCVYVCV